MKDDMSVYQQDVLKRQKAIAFAYCHSRSKGRAFALQAGDWSSIADRDIPKAL